MKFESELIKATLIKRYKRFFVDAYLENGDIVTAHCPNTGSMKGLLQEGAEIWLSPATDPKRKLRYTLEMIQAPESLVGVHTGRPNKLVQEAIEMGQLNTHFPDWHHLKTEQKYGQNARIDILLEDAAQRKCFIEVKNVTLREQNTALFPDAVTSRGAKHLAALSAESQKGHRAVMFYLVQRQDCQNFSAAANIDPFYAAELHKAMQAGVEVFAYSCDLNPHQGITMNKQLPVDI